MNKENYIITKLDSIKEDTEKIKIEQALQGKDIAQNAKDLEEHMRRTDLVEGLIKENTEKILVIENRTLWTWMKENGKFILTLAAIGGLITGALEWAIIYYSK